MGRFPRWALLGWLGAVPAGCAAPCPEPCAPHQAQAAWERELVARVPLAVDPESPIRAKRDRRRFTVSAPAPAFARAFERVMTDPDREFDFIRIDRLAQNRGQPFLVGEKFQGRYQLAKLGGVAGELPLWLTCAVENGYFSDYGMVASLDLSPPAGEPYLLRYVYLSGSPIAGSSEFRIDDRGPAGARFTQTFDWQERDRHTERLMTALVIRMHNRVVFSQVWQAAELAGGAVLCSDVEPADQVYPEPCHGCARAVPRCD